MEIKILSGWSIPVLRQILNWAIKILLVCSLLFGLTAGINWLSNLNWGSSGCGSGMTYHSVNHYFKDGSYDYTATWCQ